ncbi:MAG: hypothetical protein WCL70_03360 [Paludibacter sp.]
MKVAIISRDNSSKADFCKTEGIEPVPEQITGDIHSVCEKIKKEYCDLIVVTLELKDSENVIGSPDTFRGLELITWLRIKGIMTHILAVSFCPLDMIMKQNKHVGIIGSKGISFLQLPFEIDKSKLQKMIAIKADMENLKGVMKTMFDITAFKHSFANVWGLKRLIEVHNLVHDAKIENKSINYENSLMSSLNYAIAEYIYGNTDVKIKEDKKSQIQKKIEEIKSIKKGKNGEEEKINIIYIDDKAKFGWEFFLNTFLPEKISLCTFPIEQIDKDFTIFETNFLHYKTTKNTNLILIDLRLLDNEQHSNNYADFHSIKLMVKLLGEKLGGILQYPFLKFVLFTGNNQLDNMLNALYGSQYLPFRIFIKEGIEMNYDPDHSVNNYLKLINIIQQLCDTKHLESKESRLESFNILAQKKIEYFRKSLDAVDTFNKLQQINDKLNEYDIVILDTNILMQDPIPFIALTKNEKIKIIYPVYLELIRNTTDHEERRKNTYQKYLADFFIDYYNLTEECEMFSVQKEIFGKELSEMKKEFLSANKVNEFADEYFTPALKYYLNLENKVLFITNDSTNKKGANGELVNAPYKMAIELKDTNENLTVLKPSEILNQLNDSSRQHTPPRKVIPLKKIVVESEEKKPESGMKDVIQVKISEYFKKTNVLNCCNLDKKNKIKYTGVISDSEIQILKKNNPSLIGQIISIKNNGEKDADGNFLIDKLLVSDTSLI